MAKQPNNKPCVVRITEAGAQALIALEAKHLTLTRAEIVSIALIEKVQRQGETPLTDRDLKRMAYLRTYMTDIVENASTVIEKDQSNASLNVFAAFETILLLDRLFADEDAKRSAPMP